MSSLIAAKLAAVQQQIQEIAAHCDRNPQSITLMPVSKTVAPETIREAIAAGYPLLGENKVQEIQSKAGALADMPHQVHLIGHLQTNKVKDVIGLVSCVQSVDSLKLAKKLQQRLEFVDSHLDILIQVNTSGEDSKSGIAPEQALDLIDAVCAFERLSIKGLMTIGANTDNEEVIRACFRQLRQLQIAAQHKYGAYSDFAVLSMGMSADMKIAIEEGSTLLRVGSAIFGARDYAAS